MTRRVILALDQGTTGTTAGFFDSQSLQLEALAKSEFKQIYPQPGWVEHDPNDIWDSTMLALKQAVAKLGVAEIVCVGITNQRETVVGWHRITGEPAYNAIVWQDRRTADFCTNLKSDESAAERIYRKTGLVCDPYFSASKMRWILQNSDNAKRWAAEGNLLFGTIDTYLVHRLTGGKTFVTEHSNASRTMLYNLQTGAFDAELCDLFGISPNMLPAIIDSSSTEYGTCKSVPNIPDGTPITGCLGDQQAALFGQNCLIQGEAKITFGTGAFLLMSTGTQCVLPYGSGLLSTAAHSINGCRTFALEGAAFIAGAAVQYLRDQFGWFADSAQSEALALKDPRDENVFFVPAFAGLGAPYWNPNARATLFGLTRGTTKSQITRAVLESVTLQNVQLLKLMEQKSGMKLKRVGVDGKAALNDFLMQFQADLLQIGLVRPENIDTTAKGAARAAIMTVAGEGIYFKESQKEFKPLLAKVEAEKIVARWERAATCVNEFYTSII